MSHWGYPHDNLKIDMARFLVTRGRIEQFFDNYTSIFLLSLVWQRSSVFKMGKVRSPSADLTWGKDKGWWGLVWQSGLNSEVEMLDLEILFSSEESAIAKVPDIYRWLPNVDMSGCKKTGV